MNKVLLNLAVWIDFLIFTRDLNRLQNVMKLIYFCLFAAYKEGDVEI